MAEGAGGVNTTEAKRQGNRIYIIADLSEIEIAIEIEKVWGFDPDFDKAIYMRSP